MPSSPNLTRFLTKSSKLKTLQQLEENPQVIRSVCGITDKQTTIDECIETVRNRKREIKIEQQRIQQVHHEKMNRRTNGIILCNRRCSSNIFLELLSVILIFVAIGIGSASLDRFITVPMKVTSYLLIFPTIYYGILPYSLFSIILLSR